MTNQRYWLAIGGLTFILVAATVAIIVAGGTPTLRPRRLTPEDGAMASTNPAIQVYFARPVNTQTVDPTIRIEPPLPFDTLWSENTLTIRPQQPLAAGAEYRISIGPGVQDAEGTEMSGTIEWSFTTRQPRIAYLSFVDFTTGELWLTDLEGGEPRRLSSPSQNVQSFGAAPNGSAIIFTVEEGENNVNLWRADDGSWGLRRLTNDQNVIYREPQFSPGGDLVAVEQMRMVEVGTQGLQRTPPIIELRNPADGSPAGAVYGGQGETGYAPRWSPDGTRLAFYEGNGQAVGVYDFTTSQPAFFSGENALLGFQVWSPNSNILAYTAVVIDADGTAQQQVVLRDTNLGTAAFYGESVGDQADAAWHPDGSVLAYAYRGPPELPNSNGIWTMLPDGTGRLPLVTEAGYIFSAPLWSPDGEWLLYGKYDEAANAQSLWAIRRDGRDNHLIAEEGYGAVWVP